MTLVGVYEGASPADVLAFEAWFGDHVGIILTHLGMRSWDDLEGSAAGFSRDLWTQIDRPVAWSVPLLVQGTTLEQAATGAFNDHYRKVAQWIDRYATEDTIYIRPGWEFNGYWMPWSAKGHEQAYIDAFHQLVDTFRSVSHRFAFEWNVNNGDYGMNPATAYPGDNYVDIVGMDFYQDPAWPKDPLAAWNNMVTRPYGLQWLEDFAAAHGKPSAYSEWGVTTDNMAPYMEQARAWFAAHDVAYQIYWDSNAGGYSGKLSDGSNPHTGTGYRDAFHVPASAGLPGWDDDGTSAVAIASDAQPHDPSVAHGGGDTLQGGLGSDVLVIAGDEGGASAPAGYGADAIVTGTLPHDAETGTMTGTAGSDIPAGIGGEGNDSLYGDGGDVVVRGGAGDDFINGGAGNDELRGLSGDDIIAGGDGLDRLLGDDGNDTLIGGVGNDWLDGGAGIDTAEFTGKATDFHIQAAPQPGAWVVTELATGQADLVTNVELFKFSDITLQLAVES